MLSPNSPPPPEEAKKKDVHVPPKNIGEIKAAEKVRLQTVWPRCLSSRRSVYSSG